MKIIIVAICFTCITNVIFAQAKNEAPSSSIRIEILFPEGKTKALILSYDDGPIADRQMVKLMNDYGLKGTFHLNSNKLDTKGYLNKAEIKSLFTGHEVSVHTANHPGLSDLPKNDIIYEVVEDRKELERLTGKTVRGMAYPFGNYNDVVVDAITGIGIEYARTTNDSYNLSIPKDFLRWPASIHQFAKAYFKPNDSENDKKELAVFYNLVNDFLTSKTTALLDVWGHSWENDGEGNKWAEIEKFFKLVYNKKDIYYTTQIDLVDYINAYKNLKISINKKIIKNLSSIDIYFKIDNTTYKISGGSEIKL